MPKDYRERSHALDFKNAVPIGIFENIGDFVLGLFRGHEHYRLISLPCLHAVSFSVAAERADSFTASSDANVVCCFIRGSTVIAKSAVTGWLPGEEDTTGIEIEWTPIHGCFEKHELIQIFNSEIARNPTTRIDDIEGAAKKQMGRPRHGCGSESGSASNPSTNSIEQSLLRRIKQTEASSTETSSVRKRFLCNISLSVRVSSAESILQGVSRWVCGSNNVDEPPSGA
jgi:hypothetical protein